MECSEEQLEDNDEGSAANDGRLSRLTQRDELEADVGRRGRVGECSYADDVDTKAAKPRDSCDADVAGDFDEGPSIGERDRFFDGGVVEVVEHDDVGSGLERFGELFEGLDFDFDAASVRCPRLGPLHRLAEPSAGGDVVVFDHHRRAEIEAVVVASAMTHGFFLQSAEPGSCLSGVGDASRPGGGGDKPAGERCRSAQALQEVERRPFRHEQGACWSFGP